MSYIDIYKAFYQRHIYDKNMTPEMYDVYYCIQRNIHFRKGLQL